MHKARAVRRPSPGRGQSPVGDAELKDLLDHLGWLLAREYVALLTTTGSSERASSEGTEP